MDLKRLVRQGVDATVAHIEAPPGPKPPEHIATLSAWYQRLPTEDKALMHMAMHFSAEGSLFALLNVLDGVARLPHQDGGLLLIERTDAGDVVLNPSEDIYLYEVFNEESPSEES